MLGLSRNGIILYSIILALGVFLWLTGVISFLVYMLIFIICLLGALKSIKRRKQAGVALQQPSSTPEYEYEEHEKADENESLKEADQVSSYQP